MFTVGFGDTTADLARGVERVASVEDAEIAASERSGSAGAAEKDRGSGGFLGMLGTSNNLEPLKEKMVGLMLLSRSCCSDSFDSDCGTALANDEGPRNAKTVLFLAPQDCCETVAGEVALSIGEGDP